MERAIERAALQAKQSLQRLVDAAAALLSGPDYKLPKTTKLLKIPNSLPFSLSLNGI